MPRKTQGFSISGVQIKAQLKVCDGRLALVDHDGELILKPSPEAFEYVAENEHLTMTLMRQVGFDVPPCGLITLQDGHRVFVIRRYDRTSGGKRHQEDAMQALGIHNATSGSKYDSASYADVLALTKARCGSAVAARLLDRLVFSYLVGNDDHHLKNISFILERPVTLAPAYDTLASSLYNQGGQVMALRFFPDREPAYFAEMGNGHYSGSDFVELAKSAGLAEKAAKSRIERLALQTEKRAPDLIRSSYLPDEMKGRYQTLVSERLGFIRVM
ncbi:HipA domain-containing protein [Marinobacter sp. JSM 1782161]|uniref:HipA domain-containing protein n=1 Tax=Marinobacter sp. JSM 1782161 TaxID=2685906 RepID=UPI001401F61D|nr:HipA domain-containing protein [Marinobacter sp. JSM 1782161]